MKELLTEEDIINGFREKNSNITRTYFYGYCRMGYCVLNRRYDFANKPGMDFFSLVHEYYIALDKHDWRQLTDRKPGTSLKTWMINGFRFLVLDKLKEVQKEHNVESFEERVSKTHVEFDVTDNTINADIRAMIESICDSFYGRDTTSSIILKMKLIDGFKGKEIAEQFHITPSAVTQRFQQMMNDVVIPYFRDNFSAQEYSSCDELLMPSCDKYSTGGVINNFNNKYMDNNRNNRVTPEHISQLADNEIFVFGSNLAGMHGGGAARAARLYFGAVIGQGVGMQGQSYAIPTMQGGPETIRPYVDEFIEYAKAHSDKRFFVTRIGCGIAGFDASDIAPLFANATDLLNVTLPEDFWDELADE